MTIGHAVPPVVPTSRPRFLDALMGVRYLAAVSVLLTHHGFVAVTSAVPFFFVLSGFVLAYNYVDDEGLSVDVRAFWLARLSRIYPVYLLALLILALNKPGEVNGDHAASMTASLLMVQAWFPRLVSVWNWPSWTTSCEAFFYLVFPLIVVVALRLRTPMALAAGMAVSWLVGVAFAACFLYHERSGPALALDALFAFTKYGPIVRLPEFVVGVFLGRLYQQCGRPTSWGPVLGGAGLAAALVLTAAVPPVPYVQVHNALLAPAYAVAIWGLAGGGGLATPLSHPVLVELGLASYALYILQDPLSELFVGWTGLAPSSPGPFLLLLVFLSVVSVLVNRCFEMPVMRWMRRMYKPSGVSGPRRPATASSVAALGVLGLLMVAVACLPERSTPPRDALQNALAAAGSVRVRWDAAGDYDPYLVRLADALPDVVFVGPFNSAPLAVSDMPWAEAERQGWRFLVRNDANPLALWVEDGTALATTLLPPLGTRLGAAPVLGVEESGFYGPEQDDEGRPFRWTSGRATLWLSASPSRTGTVRLEVARDEALEVRVDGRLLSRGPVRGALRFEREAGSKTVRVELVTPTFEPRRLHPESPDERHLGIKVFGVWVGP